jgi:hypothetical protein
MHAFQNSIDTRMNQEFLPHLPYDTIWINSITGMCLCTVQLDVHSTITIILLLFRLLLVGCVANNRISSILVGQE